MGIDYLDEAKREAIGSHNPVALALIALVDELREQRKPALGRCKDCVHCWADLDGKPNCGSNEAPITLTPLPKGFGCTYFEPRE